MALPDPLSDPGPGEFDIWQGRVTATVVDHDGRVEDLEVAVAAIEATDVDSVNGQTGTVVLTATQIGSTATGDVAATNVQAAIAELASEKQTAAQVATAVGAETTARIADVDAEESARIAAISGLSSVYQPLDSDLTAVASAGNSAVLAATTASFLTADETKLDALPNAATYASDLAGKQPLDSDLTALAAAGNSAVLSATTASFLIAQDTKLNALPDNATLTASLAAKAANLDDFRYLDHGLWIPQANVTNPTDHIGTGGSGAMAGWSLAAASTLRHLVTTFVAPPGWAGMAIDLYWLNNGAGAGNVRWRVDVVSTVLGASTTATVSTVQQTITALAQNLPKQESGYSTGVAIDNTKIYRISVIRDASNVVDTLGNAVLFMGLGLRRTS